MKMSLFEELKQRNEEALVGLRRSRDQEALQQLRRQLGHQAPLVRDLAAALPAS